MPTYDYKCNACDHTFEEFQSITAKPLRKCPACGKSTLKRLIGIGAGVIFKGSGFYQTDYRSEGYKAAAKADSGSSGSTSDSKSESKSESKSDGGSSSAAKTDSSSAPAKTESKPAAKAKDAKPKKA